MEVFNGNFDKVDIEDLTPGLKKRILESSDLITYDLNRHIADKKMHISAVDRNNWDSKAPNDSPNFTGVPTAPTPSQGDASEKLATTNFVVGALKTYTPSKSLATGKLISPVNISISGKAHSEPVAFDGTNDLVLPVDRVDVTAIKGTLPVELLAGTYSINISGTASHAQSADEISGVQLNSLLLKESPIMTGVPTAPTAEIGTSTDQLATTKFVNNAISFMQSNVEAFTAQKFKRPVKMTVSGKIKADPIIIDGTNDVELNVTELAINLTELGSNISVSRINGHTVDADVPANAKFTDTVYTHPNTSKDLSAKEWLAVTVDRTGHVVEARNPDMIDVNISKNAATASKLNTKRNITLTGIEGGTVAFDGSENVAMEITGIPAALITETNDRQFLTKTQKDRIINGGITEAEVDAKINAVKSELDWKETVDSVGALSTTYPNPQKGWTVNVASDNTTYRYDGKSWVAISANSIPLASGNVDGKMSKEDKTKLDGIEAGANHYTLPATLPASIIEQSDDRYFVTKYQNKKLADLYNRTEMDNLFVTKASITAGQPLNLSGGWKIVPDNDGSLVFSFNGVEKARLGTNGTFKAIGIEESGS